MNKVLAVVICCLSLAIHSQAKEKPAPEKSKEPYISNEGQKKEADKFFKDKVVLPEMAFPSRVPGSIAYVDGDASKFTITRLLPGKPEAVMEFQTENVFEAVVDKGYAVSLSYLAFAGVSVGAQDKASVLLQKIARGKGPELLDADVQKALIPAMKSLNKPGRKFYYIETAQVVQASYVTLKESKAKGNNSFFITADGKIYKTSTSTSNSQFVVCDAIELPGLAEPVKEILKSFNTIKTPGSLTGKTQKIDKTLFFKKAEFKN